MLLNWKEVNDSNVSENMGCYSQLAVVSLLLAMLAPMGCAHNITHTLSCYTCSLLTSHM